MSIEKFAEFDRMIEKAKKMKTDEKPAAVLIHHPEVIGDNYEEMVTNLNKLSDAGLKLLIIPTSERG